MKYQSHLRLAFFCFLLLVTYLPLSAQRSDVASVPQLRAYSQQGWKIRSAHISFDSLTLYFSACAPQSTNYDIYLSHSRGGLWSTPEKLSASVNTDADELWPSISPDERRLFFIRRTVNPKAKKGTPPTDHLYMAENLRGKWEVVEQTVISSGQDLSPLILPDNRTVIFSRRERFKNRDFYALYHTQYLGYGVWNIPVRIDSADTRSLINPRLRTLNDTVLQVTEMQLSERERKEYDTFYLQHQVVIPPLMRCRRYGVLSGVVTDENTSRAVEATILLYDAITANLLTTAHTDPTTGHFRVALQSGHKYNVDITAPNYSHYYTTLDCRETDMLRQYHLPVSIAGNLRIRINTYDADLFTPEPMEREMVQLSESGKTIRIHTKREERGRLYEFPIGEVYDLSLFRRGYHDTTLTIDTRRNVRFTLAELDIPLRPVKAALVLQLGDGSDSTITEGTIRLRNRNRHETLELPYTPPTTQVLIRQEDEYEVVIQSPGHFFFDTIVSIPDGYDTQLCEAILTPIKKDMVVQLHNILFENNSYVLSRSSYDELEKVVQLLEANPELHIELSAHTDDVGSDEYNDRLSSRRGEATLNYLVSRGISRSRLTSVGYGKRRPLVPNDSDKNRAINRRVEFTVTDF